MFVEQILKFAQRPCLFPTRLRLQVAQGPKLFQDQLQLDERHGRQYFQGGSRCPATYARVQEVRPFCCSIGSLLFRFCKVAFWQTPSSRVLL